MLDPRADVICQNCGDRRPAGLTFWWHDARRCEDCMRTERPMSEQRHEDERSICLPCIGVAVQKVT